MAQKRYIYLLISDDCRILAAETGLKKLVNKYGEKYKLPDYVALVRKLKPAKVAGEQAFIEATDGTRYRLAAPRVQ